MSKFKIGDIVNVEYFENFFIKCKILHINQLNYHLEILEETEYTKVGDTCSYSEGYIKPIEPENSIESNEGLKRRILDELEFKQVLQTKPNNDFIYFKDQDMILPKKLFEQGQITIQKTVIQRLSDETKSFTNGFSVLLGELTLKKFETREQAQIFLKQLAEVLGSDIL